MVLISKILHDSLRKRNKLSAANVAAYFIVIDFLSTEGLDELKGLLPVTYSPFSRRCEAERFVRLRALQINNLLILKPCDWLKCYFLKINDSREDLNFAQLFWAHLEASV